MEPPGSRTPLPAWPRRPGGTNSLKPPRSRSHSRTQASLWHRVPGRISATDKPNQPGLTNGAMERAASAWRELERWTDGRPTRTLMEKTSCGPIYNERSYAYDTLL